MSKILQNKLIKIVHHCQLLGLTVFVIVLTVWIVVPCLVVVMIVLVIVKPSAVRYFFVLVVVVVVFFNDLVVFIYESY